MLYDTITVGYWKAISVKNCIFSKGQIDIFVFFTLNSKYNLVCLFRVFVWIIMNDWQIHFQYPVIYWYMYCDRCPSLFQLHFQFLKNLVQNLYRKYTLWNIVSLLVLLQFAITRIKIHWNNTCWFTVISSKVSHFSAFKILKTYCI